MFTNEDLPIKFFITYKDYQEHQSIVLIGKVIVPYKSHTYYSTDSFLMNEEAAKMHYENLSKLTGKH